MIRLPSDQKLHQQVTHNQQQWETALF